MTQIIDPHTKKPIDPYPMMEVLIRLPKISVVIVNSRDDKEMLDRAVNSIKWQFFQVDDIIIIKNLDRKKSIGKCFNIGVKKAKYGLVFFLGDDDWIMADYLLNLNLYLYSRAGADNTVVGGSSYVSAFDPNTKLAVPMIKTPTGMFFKKFLLEFPFDETLPKLIDSTHLAKIKKKGYKFVISKGNYSYFATQHKDQVSGSMIDSITPNERGSDYYDKVYSNKDSDYRKGFEDSIYIGLWRKILELPVFLGFIDIMDIGCGTGQFTEMLEAETLVTFYTGIDFSKEALNIAEKRDLPRDFIFYNIDLNIMDKLPGPERDVYICLETLEHIARDLHILEIIPAGKYFIGTVPNFPDPAHVRYFKDQSEVNDRYGKYFDDFKVTPFIDEDKIYYLITGIKKMEEENG